MKPRYELYLLIVNQSEAPAPGGNLWIKGLRIYTTRTSTRRIDRRDFLRKLAVLLGSAAAADRIFNLLENKGVSAEMIPADDARLTAGMINYTGATGEVSAYFSRPKGTGKLPGVVVIHENRGLNAHIKDVTRRVALEGFLALAPDALSPKGGTPPGQDQAIAMIKELDPKATLGQLPGCGQIPGQ